MTVIKPNSGLEAFVERHRADLDAFEPRPDLWDAIEARLDEPADADEPLTPVLPLHPTTPSITPDTAPRKSVFGWQRYAAAAAVAMLLLAGGYGLRRADETAATTTAEVTAANVLPATEQPAAVSEALSVMPETMPVGASQPAKRLASAVRRMEAYYAAQISEKQHELRQVDAEAAPGTMPKAADWKQELVALDSTYRQLRTELYQNPDPDAVLEAMNRNLQIRLDILNQQLRTREQIRQFHDESYSASAK